MATSKFHAVFFVSFLFALIFPLSEVNNASAEVILASNNCDELQIEVNKLTSKIYSLEAWIEKQNQDIEKIYQALLRKDEIIAQLKKAIAEKEKSNPITSLRSDVAKLGITISNHTMSYAESHWKKHGKPAFQLIRQKVLEMKGQTEQWAEPHVQTIKTFYAESQWKEHGKYAFESFMQKVLEKKAQAEKWAKPYVETIKTKWVPAALVIAESSLQSLAKMTKYVYIQSTDVVTQQWVRITRKINAFLEA